MSRRMACRVPFTRRARTGEFADGEMKTPRTKKPPWHRTRERARRSWSLQRRPAIHAIGACPVSRSGLGQDGTRIAESYFESMRAELTERFGGVTRSHNLLPSRVGRARGTQR